MKDNIYRTIKNKKEAKKVIRGIRRTEKILKFQKFTHFQQRLLELVHNFQNRKKKIKFYDYEKDCFTFCFDLKLCGALGPGEPDVPERISGQS